MRAHKHAYPHTRQMDEAEKAKVLIDKFVLPWGEGPHVHSWLTAHKATSGTGVRGLGVMSGATAQLDMPAGTLVYVYTSIYI